MNKATPNIKKCTKLINDISKMEYFKVFKPTLDTEIVNLKNNNISKGMNNIDSEKKAYKDIFLSLSTVLQNGQVDVDKYINSKISAKTISDAKQARKSVAGNLFQQAIAYLLAENVLNGNITKPVTITTSVKTILTDYASISVNGDTQKPDSDIIVYTNVTTDPILNLSCKTSFRERAGQTYKWKLLLDLATCNCTNKSIEPNCPANVYKLNYTPSKTVKVGFITADLYNEINNPQIAGMFSFFDYAYIAKNKGTATVFTLDTIINDINNLF